MIRLMPSARGMKVAFFTLFRPCGRVSKDNFNALLFMMEERLTRQAPAFTLLLMPSADMMWKTAINPKWYKVNPDDKYRYLPVFATQLQRFREFISHPMMDLDYFEKQEINSGFILKLGTKLIHFT